MKGLTTRMAAIIKAKVSKLLDRAEHPGETLDYSYERQLEHLQSVKKGIAGVITAKKRLQMQAQALEQQVERLDGQARQALAHQRDDLARAAVEQKALGRRELESLGIHIEELEQQQAQLLESEKRLRHRLEAFRARKEVIKAQYAAAEAQVRIGEAATGVGDEMADVGAAIQRAEDKTATLRARAAAVEELEAAGTLADLTELEPRSEVERELARLDLDGTIEAELEQMKAGLLAAPEPVRALEEGNR
jgi:phage shock protein A